MIIRFLVIYICLGFSTIMFSQELTVKSFLEKTNELTASTHLRNDNNDVPCALVKVQLPINGAQFEPSVIGHVDYKVNEYWVYLPNGAKHLKIKHPNYLTQDVIFENYGISKLQSKTTYELILSIPSNQNTSPVITQQYVMFDVTPKNAVVELDGELLEVVDGTATKRKVFGEYNYTIQAGLYHQKTGSIVVNDPNNKHIVKVSLEPAFGYIEIPSKGNLKNAKVYINNELKGTVPYKSEMLASGSYTIRIVKPMYNDVQQSVVVNDGETTMCSPVLSENFANVTLQVGNGATIFVNNEEKGIDSWSGALPYGAYNVECRKENHETTIKELVVTSDDNNKKITLEQPKPIVGSLDISSKPADAEIFLDGKNVGTSPMFIPNCLIGTHSVEIRRNGYATYKEKIFIEKGKTSTINATLNNGQMLAVKSIKKSEIYIDDILVGKSSFSGIVSLGIHKIYAIFDGKKSPIQTINCTNDSNNLTVDISFNSVNGHDYIDLALPSGTLWATCNLGANSPEELGDYFAWGETTPKKIFSSDNYNPGQLKYKYDERGRRKPYSSYVIDSNHLKQDVDRRSRPLGQIIELSKSEDAANHLWGDNWRIPTRNEINELLIMCKRTRAIVNGIKGYMFTSMKNGNSIFLPVVEQTNTTDTQYWTSQKGTTNRAYILFLKKNDESTRYEQYVYQGCFIRPVISPQNIKNR